MIRIEQPIIVEGKYDKITLENAVDALIIPTNGFGIFKDKEKCALIRRLAQDKGIVIMTDSDSAGSVIRSYIKRLVGDCEIINVYVPCLKGKEKRKASAGKEGLLGVEGMSEEVILAALSKSGVTGEKRERKSPKITKTDMFELGLSGSKDSALKRDELLRYLKLPEKLSPNAMLDVINSIFSLEEFVEVVKLCQEGKTKS